jgi:hypothetical protein
MLHRNALAAIVSALVVAAAASGFEWRPVSATPRTASLEVRIRPAHGLSATTRSFAIAAPEDAGLSVRASGDAGMAIQPSAGGYMGDRYCHWFLLTISAPSPLPDTLAGAITIHSEQPLFGSLAPAPRFRRSPIVRLGAAAPLHKPSAVSNPPALPYASGLRIEVAQDGIYYLSAPELIEAGAPVTGVDSRTIRLYSRGEQVPLYITNPQRTRMGADDAIMFYGSALRTEAGRPAQFDDSNVYWLCWGGAVPGIRVAEASGGKRRADKLFVDIASGYTPIAAREFPDTVHYEEDNDIRWLGSIFDSTLRMEQSPVQDDIDNWYWKVLGKESDEVSIAVVGPARDKTLSARLHIGFMGLSSVDGEPEDHRIRILLNGFSPGKTRSQYARWDGQREHVFSSDPFAVSQLEHGLNTITFEIENRGFTDRSALNWIRLEYMRDFRAYENQCVFRNHPADRGRLLQYDVSGFTSRELELWDIEQHRYFGRFAVRAADRRDRFALTFQDSIAGHARYLAQATSRRLSPVRMQLDTVPAQWLAGRALDYIMITPDSLREILEPLAAVHERRGLSVAVVSLEDIYARFAYGIRDPESIRDMLRHMHQRQGADPPRYVLLAGDGTHDLYKKNESHTLAPVKLSRVPGWGPSADDGYFVTVRGNDNFPDMHIGRFPAQNGEQLELIVQKTIDYITRPSPGYWKDNLLIAGGIESDFTAFNDEIAASIVGPSMNIIRMDAHPGSRYYVSESQAARAMAGHINAGVFAINFAGHGGGNIWSDSRFFSYDDLDLLHNAQWSGAGRLPVIFSFTCLTGFFESVAYPSLGEEFLRASPSGAAAFYGAAGYTKKSADLFMDRLLLANAFHGEAGTLGELIGLTETMALVHMGVDAIPVIRQYNLLGDPALPWRLTPDTMTVSAYGGEKRDFDTLRVTASTAPVTNGTIKVRVSADDQQWAEWIGPVDDASFDKAFALKSGVSTANGIVRIYAWNDSGEVRGWTRFSRDTALLHDIALRPATPALGDTVRVSCRIRSETPADQIMATAFFAVARPHAGRLDFEQLQELRMVHDSADFWRSERAIRLDAADPSPNAVLYVKFRVSPRIGETALHSFPLRGKPDLTFTDSTLALVWRDDSLRLELETLNRGNLAAPPVDIVFKWGEYDTPGDTIGVVSFGQKLRPGQVRAASVALPDTQGTLMFSARVNPRGAFDELLDGNNTVSGTRRVRFARLADSDDTLVSAGGGCTLHPDSLTRPHTVFLFEQALKGSGPMQTAVWAPLRTDGTRGFWARARPALAAHERLRWSFLPEAPLAKSRAEASKYAIFAADSVSGAWHASPASAGDGSRVYMITGLPGPHALGAVSDTAAPRIQAFSGGREILFLDYVPKGKPLSLFLSDESGIAPGSIRLLLNDQPLNRRYHSEPFAGDDPTSVSLSVYPPGQNRIDSLTVTAADRAGNEARKTFAYMPGRKLAIRFFSCHPNPFTARMTANGPRLVRFAFLLTDEVDEVSLTVYTLADRKVWSWKSARTVGYQEAAWDGTTASGERIANGLYYAKLVARNKDRTAVKIIRIAKLEGY